MAASKGVINVTLPFTAVTPTSSSGIIVMDHGDQIKDDNDMHHLRYIFYLIESVDRNAWSETRMCFLFLQLSYLVVQPQVVITIQRHSNERIKQTFVARGKTL